MTAPHDLPYNEDLAPLQGLLGAVERPGDFCVHGALPLPLPQVEVEGIGLLSFPLLPAQTAALVAAAERAPYGRGAQTVLDTTVRRVWQIDPKRVRLGGKTWPASLRQVLAAVAHGLGCESAAVDAALYKLLIYEPGDFFVAHRDSEKAPGMFGTLLLQLPASHQGGELCIRHGAREIVIDLSATDLSEIGSLPFMPIASMRCGRSAPVAASASCSTCYAPARRRRRRHWRPTTTPRSTKLRR